MSLFNQLAAFLLLILPLTAQAQTFNQITIKPSRSADPRTFRLQILPDGDLVGTTVDIPILLSYAYDVPTNPSPRLSSLPGWVLDQRYDIEAKAPAGAVSRTSSSSETHDRMQHRMRRMLADRFGLVMRVENRRMSVYALAVRSGGPKLQKSAIGINDCIFDTAPQGCHSFVIGFGHPLNANAIAMDDLVHYIENWTDLPVINSTGLDGLFTVHTQGWRPMRLPPPPPNGNGHVDFTSLSTITSVLGKLGLELNRQNAVLPVYTVNRIERPVTQ